MEADAPDDADEPDDLFVRPVVRIAAPAPAESTATGSECHGKRQRSQVGCAVGMRLRRGAGLDKKMPFA